MKILVLNCGSSSIKYQLIDMDNNAKVMAKGLIERIGLEMGEFTHKYHGEKHYEQLPIPDHVAGINLVLKALTDSKMGVISDLKEINAVGHRVAHGGEKFSQSVVITEEVIKEIEKLKDIAPLHIPGSVAGIRAMQKVLPNVPMTAVFDTSFHLTMPAESYLYAIPYEYYEKYRLRRYGFHGTSHKYVAENAAKMIGKDWKNMKIITCHLGSGASIAAIKNGQSVDTSMGFTPLEGLVMGSRCGDLDAGALIYLAEKENLDMKTLNTILNKKSGLVGISGGKQDMRDVRAGRDAGDERCTYAFNMFAHRVKKYIGAYTAIMNGVDMVVMTGGIGENAWFMREPILSNMEFLGISIDKAINEATVGDAQVISTPDSKVTVVVFPTDEELVIAQDTLNLVR
ncbi:MAG: acetate kinase [Bacteroidales bacterium]|jgi:acetate kinase|nr:acetate kinase [Bacteroidales bacterium]MBQ4478406.1 acetate kinase [Bacteroidales bacterium]MBR4453883.1 acetate kinase [Bacteroidales bacterium]MCR5554543.1 acetate kinase [Bacteroidales bacterium]